MSVTGAEGGGRENAPASPHSRCISRSPHLRVCASARSRAAKYAGRGHRKYRAGGPAWGPRSISVALLVERPPRLRLSCFHRALRLLLHFSAALDTLRLVRMSKTFRDFPNNTVRLSTPSRYGDRGPLAATSAHAPVLFQLAGGLMVEGPVTAQEYVCSRRRA